LGIVKKATAEATEIAEKNSWGILGDLGG